jgi:hypothetical protein
MKRHRPPSFSVREKNRPYRHYIKT